MSYQQFSPQFGGYGAPDGAAHMQRQQPWPQMVANLAAQHNSGAQAFVPGRQPRGPISGASIAGMPMGVIPAHLQPQMTAAAAGGAKYMNKPVPPYGAGSPLGVHIPGHPPAGVTSHGLAPGMPGMVPGSQQVPFSGAGAGLIKTAQGVQQQQPHSAPDEVLRVLDSENGGAGDESMDGKGKRVIEVVKKDAERGRLIQKLEMRNAALIFKKQAELDYLCQLRVLRQTQPNAVFGDGYQGYGNSWTGSKVHIIYPQDRKRSRRHSKELFLTDEQVQRVAEAEENLVPIRLDFDTDTFRLRDMFIWNINDETIPLDVFAQNMLEDFAIPISLAPTIANSIKDQLEEFHPHPFPAPKTVEQLQAAEYYNEDMRILIKLDIIIGQHQLVDQFEWDMNCPYNSPEQFAQTMCNDLCLPGEFANSIAHSIREQTQIHTKTLFLVGHSFDGRPVEDEEVRKEILPQVRVEGLIRPNASLREYTPQLFEIPEAELDRVDKDRDRDSRRKRRQGRASRRGAAQLPDLHETMRTYCSPVYNGLLPGGIDKNLEIFRKQIKAGDSDDEDSTSRRFRPLPGPFTSRRDILGSPGDIGPPTPPIRIVPGEHYVIKLKVPRLREWLARRQQQPFVK